MFLSSPHPPKLRTPHPFPARHVSLLSSTSLHFPKATSISGSASEFPEQVAGSPANQPIRRRRIAGVDQEDLVDPTKLADPDSAFFEFNGVQIHHKISHHDELPDSQSTGTAVAGMGVPMVLLHGFGASVFSWARVMGPLARLTRSKVVAFDRPGFGLTERVAVVEERAMGLNPYSMAFSVLATAAFVELLGAGKAVLMGHSAGCLVAVNTYFDAPEKVAALILVAPAIVAPLILKKREENRKDDRESDSGSESNPFVRIWSGVCRLFRIVAGMVFHVLKGMRDMVGAVYTKAAAAVLRSGLAVMLVRMIMDKFGIQGVRKAWYDATKVTDYVLRGYTKPLRAKGWEKALLEYTIAMITDSTSKSVPPLTKRLSEITCPVLIVTGDTDRLVPSWNAERLSRAIPGSAFEVIKNCGHIPHEEKVEEFLQVVEKFLLRVFGAQDVPLSQAADHREQ